MPIGHFLPPAVRHGEGYVFSLSVNRGRGAIVQNFATRCPTELPGGGPIFFFGVASSATSGGGGVPKKIGQRKSVKKIGHNFFFVEKCGGRRRYASCGHAGGLSCCLFILFVIFTNCEYVFHCRQLFRVLTGSVYLYPHTTGVAH